MLRYLDESRRRKASDAEPTAEEQVASKVLLEQMLAKMKNLREELSTHAGVRRDLLDTLASMGAAAERQV